MPMTFGDATATIERIRDRARANYTRIGAKPHRSALPFNFALRLHYVDNRIGRGLIEFARISMLESENIARVLDYHHLQTQADSQDWYAAFACIAHRANFALDPALAKPRRDYDTVGLLQSFSRRCLFQVLRVDVVD